MYKRIFTERETPQISLKRSQYSPQIPGNLLWLTVAYLRSDTSAYFLWTFSKFLVETPSKDTITLRQTYHQTKLSFHSNSERENVVNKFFLWTTEHFSLK